MEEIRRRFTGAVAAKLASAPQSTAKDELVEELSDNLYRRFLDMTGAGMDEETAFRRAMDDLGDVDELLGYLGGSAQSQAGAAGPQSDFDAILSGVSEACNAAIDQAKSALKLAKDALQRRTTVERDDRRVRVHFNTRPDSPPPHEEPARHAPPHSGPVPPSCGDPGRCAPPPPPQVGPGWEFEAEMDPDQGRFFAGGGPRERADVVYGFGYDKARGGFFAQWGQSRDGAQENRGPHFNGEDAAMTNNDNGSYSVTALRDLRGIEVHTAAGDVAIHVSEAPDAGVIIDGDVDDLDVTCSADGVLTIREGRTASSSFFSRRGFRSADVELFLPRRPWETISVTTASGDVDIDRGELDVDRLSVKTANGDLNCRLASCAQLTFHSASGDLDLAGSCAQLSAETMSGDISLEGQVEDAFLKSASGDISLEGLVRRFRGSALSGDVSVETSVLPEVMELSSKSGDCEARLPDTGSFSLRYSTVSGDADFRFPFRYEGGAAVCGSGAGPVYSMTTVSGDLSVGRR